MTISEPPLSHRCAPPLRGSGRGTRLATEGTLFRDISRYASDQKMFGVKTRKRRGGGTVLVDASGSMGFKGRDIDEIIEGAPEATTVAMYSGREMDGELRVLVKDGRRIGEDGLEPYGSGNIVDVPALEWLAKQPAPRVIISDGGYTGEGDQSSREIRLRCAQICRQARIERVANASETARFLMGQRVAARRF